MAKFDMISFKKFMSGHALSRSNQPNLAKLFAAVAGADKKPVTFVLGAGLSVDAGMPLWDGLVERIAEEIADSSLRRMVLDDGADPMRKAEYLFELVQKKNQRRKREVIVRRALRLDVNAAPAGTLSQAVANLVLALGSNARVITMNFDGVFEAALETLTTKKPVSYGLLQASEWKTASEAEGGIHVLHVHGMVRHDQDPILPLVLSESHFLKDGPEVRRVIREMLPEGAIVFVGVSLSDPNLVGPLWDTRNDRSLPERFVVAVPDRASTKFSYADSVNFALRKARYLNEDFNTRPVFVKAYSQLTQLMWELRLSVSEPTRYEETKPSTSLAYGHRFTRILNGAYTQLGLKEPGALPEGALARDLSDRLFRFTRSGSAFGDALDKVLSAYAIDSNEMFGVELWLRARSGKVATTPFELDFIGSSAFAHREHWSGRPSLAIDSRSYNPIVEVLFQGSTVRRNIDSDDGLEPLWKGMFAAPIRLWEIDRNTDPVIVGVVSLLTSHGFPGLAEAGTLRGKETSVLDRITDLELQRLQTALEIDARELLRPAVS